MNGDFGQSYRRPRNWQPLIVIVILAVGVGVSVILWWTA